MKLIEKLKELYSKDSTDDVDNEDNNSSNEDMEEIDILSMIKNASKNGGYTSRYSHYIDKDLEETEEEKKHNLSISKYRAYQIADSCENLKTDFIRATKTHYTYIGFNDKKITLIKENSKWYWEIEILSADISGSDGNTFWDGSISESDTKYLKCLVDANTGEYIYLGKKDYEIKEISSKKDCLLCDKMLNMLIQDEKRYNKDIDPNFKVDNYYYRAINNDKNLILLGYFYKKKLVGYLCIKLFSDDALFDALYVLEKYRNSYVATKLLRRGITLVKDRTIKSIMVNTLYENEGALNLYRSVGFIEHKVELRIDNR